MGAAGRARPRCARRGAAGRVQPAGPGLGPAAVAARPARRHRLRRLPRPAARAAPARRRPADRPRRRAVAAVVGAAGRVRRPRHLRALRRRGHARGADAGGVPGRRAGDRRGPRARWSRRSPRAWWSATSSARPCCGSPATSTPPATRCCRPAGGTAESVATDLHARPADRRRIPARRARPGPGRPGPARRRPARRGRGRRRPRRAGRAAPSSRACWRATTRSDGPARGRDARAARPQPVAAGADLAVRRDRRDRASRTSRAPSTSTRTGGCRCRRASRSCATTRGCGWSSTSCAWPARGATVDLHFSW